MAGPLQYRIVGSGPVALACALFMVRGGIDARRVQLHLPALAQARPADDGHAPGPSADGAGEPGTIPRVRRMLAISDGSRQLLSRVIAMPAAGVIERIEIALSGRSGRTRIEARDFKLPALGHVVAYPDLVAALRDAAAALPFAAPAQPHPSTVQAVTIHADGLPRRAGSRGREFRARDFEQSALLTEVMAQTAGATAYECFGRRGPLALLPAGTGHSPRYAVVWCDEPALTAARVAMTPAQLSTALTEAFAAFGTGHATLGALRVCSAVEAAPLSRVRRVNSARGREVWIGNAAQALHPVAGQGLNLGLRDAFELARSLADNEYADDPLEPAQVLARFAMHRRIDRTITTSLTDLLASSFTWPLARPLQSALLTAMDLLPPLRQPLARVLLFGSR